MNRQLINLIGGFVTVLVLVAGVLLVGLPMYSGAQSAEKEADKVAQANATQQTVIDGLRVQQATFDELERELALLREEIAREPRVDDVVELALAAVDAHGGTVDSVTATEAEPFAVRVGETEAGAPAADPATDAAAEATEAADAAEASADAAADTSGDPAAGETPAPTTPDATQQQVPVTLAITAPSVEAATAIVDALRQGPRLVAVTQATTTTSEGEGVKLTVEVLVFVNRS